MLKQHNLHEKHKKYQRLKGRSNWWQSAHCLCRMRNEALFGLHNFENSIYCSYLVGQVSVAHQAMLCLSSVSAPVQYVTS
ncbi:hypothetical protein A8109_12125 [Escherichia coli]|uniref:Uncharacterized protein n=1 Tax=Shigella boydii TaxID=621 RepID=A0A1S9JG16_SHIBO|nr:hypothetical protein CDH88_09025 [Escherichia coli]OOO81748.1 hypothetical protein AJR17_010105 [Shigella boydii]ASA67915.1 hypothetical protein CDH89_24305 [Escherichia coli]AUX66543.1 hypothetical protein CDC27_21740 [Escherichia coli]OTC10833.1 hypothetical protein AW074_22750 [Escherichia coli]